MQIERVYIVRHGQTEWNAIGRWQGFAPVPLNDEGHTQAKKLGAYLRTCPIGDVYSSDLPRALQTASYVTAPLGLTPRPDPRLREIHLGRFQGLSKEEINARYPGQLEAMHADYMDYLLPDGESRRQLQARAYAAWREIVEQGTGPEVVIVSHGGTIKALMMKLFESDAPALRKVDFGNTSITTLLRAPAGWRVTGLAAAPHLQSAANVIIGTNEGDV